MLRDCRLNGIRLRVLFAFNCNTHPFRLAPMPRDSFLSLDPVRIPNRQARLRSTFGPESDSAQREWVQEPSHKALTSSKHSLTDWQSFDCQLDEKATRRLVQVYRVHAG